MDRSHVLRLLGIIYGARDAPALLARLEHVLARQSEGIRRELPRSLTQADALLITYPDQVRAPGEAPLRTLARLANTYLPGLVNTIHLLPFFPSSSDDGFSVTDYRSVDAAHGDWEDIQHLGRRFGLMFDAVINHASAQGSWFQAFLRNEEPFSDFFIDVKGAPSLTSVVRPRTTPLLTDFGTPTGMRSIWTTFGADQADLNYRNPEVLLRILDTLLYYVGRGASAIRLDAIGYIWKELGTACIHLPQAHAIVSLVREAILAVAPQVLLLTETNVSQRENLRYLGEGRPEAHLAYNFALPPLLLHAFLTAQATTLTDWAAAFPTLPDGTAVLNVLATHDGIGLNGCRGFLPESEIDLLAKRIEAAGGYVSRKAGPGGASDPYELNINYMDALDAARDDRGQDQSIQRFLTAHAIMLALQGVPALYFQSLFGSKGWKEGVNLSGRPRSINREKLAYADLCADLANAGSVRSQVYGGLARLFRARKTSPAFSPSCRQEVLRAGDGLLAILRGDDAADGQVMCIHNVTHNEQPFEWGLWSAAGARARVYDMISQREFEFGTGVSLRLAPYEFLWLRIADWEEGTQGRLPQDSDGG